MTRNLRPGLSGASWSQGLLWLLLSCALLAGCAGIQVKQKSLVFVLHNCHAIEDVDVHEADGTSHDELTCECLHASQHLDAKTGRTVIECR